MRLFILIFGMVAAIFGVLGSLVALTFQLYDVSTGGRDSVDGFIFLALALSAVGLIGARLALRYPRISSTVMATAAVGGVLSVAWFFAIPALLFSIASTLGFLWRNETPSGLKLS